MKKILLLVMLVGCNKVDEYRHRQETTEAKLLLNKIGKEAKAAFITNDHFPKGKAATLPESAGAACCEGPGHKCSVSTTWASDPVWKELDFRADEPTRFRYTYESADGQSFTATAVGDLDCDGKTITYTLTGTAKDGNPSVMLVEPAANDD